MGKQITTAIYSKRILERSAGAVTAIAYTDLETPAKHRCLVHGKFTLSPKVALYQGTTPCPECRSTTKIARTNATKQVKRAAKVKEYLKIITKTKVLRMQATLQELIDATCTTTFNYTCLGCGSKDNRSTLGQASKNKHGCRTCVNKITNKGKVITPKELLADLRAKFPNVTILRVKPDSRGYGTGRGLVVFECTNCNEIVERSKWPFLNPVAIHMCRVCTTAHVASASGSSGGQVRRFTHRKTGKVFNVRGSYEPLAIRLLAKSGIPVKDMIPAQDLAAVEYTFDGKVRLYLPDLGYANTIVEVKSIYTAGLKVSTGNYYGFRMLKAKARAVTALGRDFKLMLFVETSKGKQPRLVSLPADWASMKASKLIEFIRRH